MRHRNVAAITNTRLVRARRPPLEEVPGPDRNTSNANLPVAKSGQLVRVFLWQSPEVAASRNEVYELLVGVVPLTDKSWRKLGAESAYP